MNYRSKVLKRTIKKCITLMIIMAIPGIVMGVFRKELLLLSLPAFIPIIYLADKAFITLKWTLVQGIIDDVTLLNDFDQPYTEAHIIYKTKDNAEHKCVFTISHYGDYKEGIEPELESMLQEDKEKYMKKEVPVFYSTKDVNKCMVYLEDAK